MPGLSPDHAMLLHFVAAAFAHDKPGRVGVAVSGGGDSMALLRLMAHWAAGERVALHAVTVDHGLRPEAAREAEFVAETCARLGIPHQLLTWDGWDGQGNLQAAARRARYDLIGNWARSEGIDTVALGHTANDQAETFVMRLAREAGIDGLTGMRRRRLSHGIHWVRPLLMQERAELRAFLRQVRQPWIDDPSNEDEAFDRIKARRAIDALGKLDIDIHVLGRVMDHLAQVRGALDHATRAHAEGCVTVLQGDLLIERAAFLKAPPEVNRRLAAHALRWLSGAEYGPRGMKLQAFLAAMARGRDATLHGVRLIGGSSQLRLCREAGAVSQVVAEIGAAWDGRWIVTAPAPIAGEVRALGEAGLAALGGLPEGAPPRPSLAASPAIWDGARLVAAPLAGFGSAQAAPVHPPQHFFTALLSH